MDECGPINADTYLNRISLKQFAVVIRNERGVGLKRVLDCDSVFSEDVEPRYPLGVKRGGKDKWFARMPVDEKRALKEAIFPQVLDNGVHRWDAHA
jgi:hypothetical protein